MQPCGRELYQGWVNLNAGPTATYSQTVQRDSGDISGNNYSIIGLLIIRTAIAIAA